MLNHPTIRNMERTGYPDGREPEYPRCPVCGAECATVYWWRNEHIAGCENCLCPVDAWGEPECFPRKEI